MGPIQPWRSRRVHAKSPMLSAYLGHQNLLATEVYLKETPQLLELASTRFEQHLRCARQLRWARSRHRRSSLVESFFTYLPRQRGASARTIRAYRDTLKLLLLFAAQRQNREIAALRLDDLDGNMIAAFLDHLETTRYNSDATATAAVPRCAAFSSTFCATTLTMRSVIGRTDQCLIATEGCQMHVDGRQACWVWTEERTQGGQVRQFTGIERSAEFLGQFTLAAAIMSQRQQFDRDLAGLSVGQFIDEHVEGPAILSARAAPVPRAGQMAPNR
ncbi:MAG: hypothetical protein EOS36_30270 [Mesorhizobium sp.]|nr:MAG: hypothetical protein EOS36_30270 [Mesorhizobium sp.]RWE30435.1 MAG: hypothetical protein EOS79_32850 [Mesorhizobium sp.]